MVEIHSCFVYILCICLWLILLQLWSKLNAIMLWRYKPFLPQSHICDFENEARGHWPVSQHKNVQQPSPLGPVPQAGETPAAPSSLNVPAPPTWELISGNFSGYPRNINNKDPLKMKNSFINQCNPNTFNNKHNWEENWSTLLAEVGKGTSS